MSAFAVADSSTRLVYSDAKEGITYGRRLARFLKYNGCYNPSSKLKDDKEYIGEAPSLEKAWEYFEHFVLPRCLVQTNESKTGGKYIRAEIGEHEKETMLYPFFKTPLQDLGDFGIGVGLYFSTLRYLGIICFIAGCINIPVMQYFSSSTYLGTSGERALEEAGLRRGSAICTMTSWEICSTCTEDDWNAFPSTDDRFTLGERDDGSKVAFIKKNGCSINNSYGILSLATLIFITIAVYYWILSLRKKIRVLDENQQSSSDYTVEVKNPPTNENAYKPEVWKDWFQSTFEDVEVAACSVVLDNENLVKALLHRRRLIQKFQDLLPNQSGFDIDDLQSNVEKCKPDPFWKRAFCTTSTAETLYNQILKQDGIIDDLSKRKYKVASVFVTFQTQRQQQAVLQELLVPMLRKGLFPESFRFQGKILNVARPAEPSATRWDDLNTPFLVSTTFLSFRFSLKWHYLYLTCFPTFH